MRNIGRAKTNILNNKLKVDILTVADDTLINFTAIQAYNSTVNLGKSVCNMFEVGPGRAAL